MYGRRVHGFTRLDTVPSHVARRVRADRCRREWMRIHSLSSLLQLHPLTIQHPSAPLNMRRDMLQDVKEDLLFLVKKNAVRKYASSRICFSRMTHTRGGWQGSGGGDLDVGGVGHAEEEVKRLASQRLVLTPPPPATESMPAPNTHGSHYQLPPPCVAHCRTRTAALSRGHRAGACGQVQGAHMAPRTRRQPES